VTRVKWKPDSVHLEIVLILTEDWCKVCPKRAIGSKIIFITAVVLLGDVGHVESHFDLFEDSASLGAR
jgi:hypothetical protein